jgi:hypothetical protein
VPAVGPSAVLSPLTRCTPAGASRILEEATCGGSISLLRFPVSRIKDSKSFEMRQLLHCIYKRREPLDADFEPVTRFNWPDAARGAGEDDVAGHQRHVGGDETDQIVAIENELACVRVLTQLPVLKELNGQIMRIDLRFNVGSKRRESVE